ncbi:hypothetical protein CD351_09590 [Erythrobacter sp. KY5]|nr:hypothetical protein CD351_09590 [Erythrobacter sp. KY5]
MVLIVGLILITPGLFLGALLIANAETTVYERTKSPDGGREARVQFTDAGAISRFERFVFVKSNWVPSDSAWFSCRAFWAHGEPEIDLEWRDNSTLLIKHHAEPRNIADVAPTCGSVKIVTMAVEPFEDL